MNPFKDLIIGKVKEIGKTAVYEPRLLTIPLQNKDLETIIIQFRSGVFENLAIKLTFNYADSLLHLSVEPQNADGIEQLNGKKEGHSCKFVDSHEILQLLNRMKYKLQTTN